VPLTASTSDDADNEARIPVSAGCPAREPARGEQIPPVPGPAGSDFQQTIGDMLIERVMAR
jgi:hypothetical protein